MMNNHRLQIIRKAARIVLSVLLCLTLIPVGAFAEETGGVQADTASETEIIQDVETGTTAEEEATAETTSDNQETAENQSAGESGTTVDSDTSTESGTTDADTSQEAEQEEPVTPAPNTAKTLKMSGLSLKFKTKVLVDDPLDKHCSPSRTWIKGNKKSIKVSWSKVASSAPVDGFIILRKAGKAKVYTEIKKVGKTTYTFTDKKAKKKNTVYTYTVVGYKKEGSNIRISPCATWAQGVTTKSKLKNGYKATISKKSASLQVGGTVTLKLKYSKPKKIQNSKSFRWYSDNTSVAKVSKGKVTAVAPGTTTIRGRLASGSEYTCKVKVVGAFKPAKPVVELDYSTTESVAIMWGKAKHATSYDIYCSKDNADKYDLIANVKGTSYLHSGLEEKHLYSYIVQARNDNGSYTELSDRSDALEQNAVKTPRKTRVSGFPSKKSVKARSHCTFTIKVTAPDSRKATLQQYVSKKWVDKETVKLPAGIDTESVTVTLPDSWWKSGTTTWRMVFPKSEGATAYTTGNFKLTTTRYYQNPKKYVQIRNKISKHGYSYYTCPVLVNNMSTKSDHIEAMIKTAYKYLGDPYVVCQSRAPGKGVDCSGLVMQACYGAGVDLWPCNPHRHRSPAYEYESRNIAKMGKLKTVSYSNRKRGDLIFYANGSGTVIHVAIYLGNDKIIHSSFAGVHVSGMGYKYGHISKVKRIFN